VRILTLTDTHWGYSDIGDMENMALLEQARMENPNLILHSGDIGNMAKDTQPYLSLLRKMFPDIPILAVLGNHDLWANSEDYQAIIDTQVKLAKEKNVVILEGGYIDYEGIRFYGLTGWYFINHRTRDSEFILNYDLKVFRDLQKKSDIEFQNILDNALESDMATMLLTHFHWPIYGNTDLYDLERNSYCGANPHYREYAYLFDYIVFGHNHEEAYTVTEDTIFVNSGSNYECPAYQIIDI